MDVRIEAGTLAFHASAEMQTPVVSTKLSKVLLDVVLPLTFACLNPAPISINGHSLSAVNPDFSLGGKAMLVLA